MQPSKCFNSAAENNSNAEMNTSLDGTSPGDVAQLKHISAAVSSHVSQISMATKMLWEREPLTFYKTFSDDAVAT